MNSNEQHPVLHDSYLRDVSNIPISMKILAERDACNEALDLFERRFGINDAISLRTVIRTLDSLIKEGFDYTSWLAWIYDQFPPVKQWNPKVGDLSYNPNTKFYHAVVAICSDGKIITRYHSTSTGKDNVTLWDIKKARQRLIKAVPSQ